MRKGDECHQRSQLTSSSHLSYPAATCGRHQVLSSANYVCVVDLSGSEKQAGDILHLERHSFAFASAHVINYMPFDVNVVDGGVWVVLDVDIKRHVIDDMAISECEGVTLEVKDVTDLLLQAPTRSR